MPLRKIRRTPGGPWHIVGTVAGQRVRETTGTTDSRIAEEKRSLREAELHRAAVFGPASVVTWEQAVLSYTEVHPPSPGTAALLLRIGEHLGNPHLKSIDQAAIDGAIKALCRPGAAAATKLRNVITPIRAVMAHAARRGWCQPQLFETPRGAHAPARTRWLTPAEAERLCQAAPWFWDALVPFLLDTGARGSEALPLQWNALDLTTGRVTLNLSKQGGIERICQLRPRTVAALANAHYPQGRGRKRTWHTERVGAVFRSDEGLPYDEGAVLKSAWRTMCKRAGLGPDVTPYTLRHTFCTWHYALHKDLLMLRDEMCWSTVELAERYAKLGPPGLADEVRAFWDRRHIIDTRPWHGTTISSELKAVS